MIKWKLMLTTLPFVAVAVVVRALLDNVIQLQGVVDFSDVALVLTGGIFLIGFMLAGVMADFKESEKLPAELACSLETIEESLHLAATARPVLDVGTLRGHLHALTNAILEWLTHKRTPPELFAALAAFSAPIHDLDKAGAGGMSSRILGELHTLRKTVTRIHVISRTSFLQSGYALLETLVVVICVLMQLSRFKSMIAEYLLIAFVTLIFVYMLRLIRDLDDPFEYSPDGTRGAAEVDLFPLHEYADRLRARIP